MHNNENIDELSYVIMIVKLFILCHPNFYQYHECSLQLSTVLYISKFQSVHYVND